MAETRSEAFDEFLSSLETLTEDWIKDRVNEEIDRSIKNPELRSWGKKDFNLHAKVFSKLKSGYQLLQWFDQNVQGYKENGIIMWNQIPQSLWQELAKKAAFEFVPWWWAQLGIAICDDIIDSYATAERDLAFPAAGAGVPMIYKNRKTQEYESPIRINFQSERTFNDSILNQEEHHIPRYQSLAELTGDTTSIAYQPSSDATSPYQNNQSLPVETNYAASDIDWKAVTENYAALRAFAETMEQKVEELKQEVETLRQKVLTLEKDYLNRTGLDLNKGASDAASANKKAAGSQNQGSSANTGASAEQEKNKAHSLFQFIAEAGQEAWAKVSQSARQHLQNVLQGTESFSQAFRNIWKSMVQETQKLLFEKLYQAWIKPTVDKWSDGITDFFKNLFRADGGAVEGQNAYIVGEKGPELFVPNSPGTIIPNDRLYLSPTQSQSQPITVNVVNKTGVEATAKAQTKFDGQRYVVDVFLDAYARNVGGMRDVLAARR